MIISSLRSSRAAKQIARGREVLRNILLTTMVLTVSCAPLATAGPIEELVAAAQQEAYDAVTYEVCVPDVDCMSVASLLIICVPDLPCVRPSDACAAGLACPALVEKAIRCATGDPGCGGAGHGRISGKLQVSLA